jgi:hypothetical protein
LVIPIIAIVWLQLASLSSEVISPVDFVEKANAVEVELSHLITSGSHLNTLMGIEKLKERFGDDLVALNILAQKETLKRAALSEYKIALEIDDKFFGNTSSSDSLPVKFDVVPALQIILESSAHTNIVMINEAHHVARHRILTHDLLKPLYERGYRYFAVESLSVFANLDSNVNRSSGELTQETIFAQTINKAREIGYKLIAYDVGGDSIDKRELNAANRIYREVFRLNPNAKALIHVGYAHIDERSWLAGKLNTLLDTDVLTIDQTKIREKSKRLFEHSIYDKLVSKKDINIPFVLSRKDKSIWSASPDKFDYSVMWPRTEYIGGRANWMRMDREKLEIKSNICQDEYPCQIEVFSGDRIDVRNSKIFIPHDRIQFTTSGLVKDVFLKNGTNSLVISNADGEVISIQQANQ